MRTFVSTDDESNKFWNIDLHGVGFTVTFGRTGTKGQTQVKTFPDESAALKARDKLVAEKLGKGYVETTASEESPASPLRDALELALAENPDDIASHMAYADYLMEQGDPRGEFIQARLALEDTGRGADERARLQARADELLARHAKQWLGDVGRFFVGDWSGPDKPFHFEFRRGWPDVIRLLSAPDAPVAALARSPEARLLRRLEVVYDMRYHPFDFDRFAEGLNGAMTGDEERIDTGTFWLSDGGPILSALLDSPYLTNIRVFKVGFSDDADLLAYSSMVSPFEQCTAQQVIQLLEKWTHFEELYLNADLADIADLFASPALGNLRVLQYYYASNYSREDNAEAHPLTILASNPALRSLTTLRLHPDRATLLALAEVDAVLRSPNLPSLTHLQLHVCSPEVGDEICRRIIDSGILRRLKTLDVAYGNITDAGARLLAGCPDLAHLDSLDVSRNALTPVGVAALRATGVRVVAEEQHDANDEDVSFDCDME